MVRVREVFEIGLLGIVYWVRMLISARVRVRGRVLGLWLQVDVRIWGR